MRILQTVVRSYPYIGGGENYVYYLSKELARNHEVTLICSNEPRSPHEEIVENIRFRRLDYVGKISNTNIPLNLPFVLTREKFDVMHTHFPTPWFSDFSATVAKIKMRPTVLTYHNDITGDGINGYVSKIYNSTFLKILLRLVEKIIVTQEAYIERSPFLKQYIDKIEIIPAGVDTNKFKPTITRGSNGKDCPTIFFLSNLDEYHRYKGLFYLLNALKIVKRTMSDFKLIVGGKGSLIGEYKKLAKKLGIEENVEFHGFISNEKLASYYSYADIFVLPSVSNEEGFGMVALESLACGTPVIVTDIVGVSRDLADYKAGIVVKPRDVEDLSKSIIKLINDPEGRLKMGRNGRKLVEEKYTWREVARRTEKIYEDLTEN
ncbi:glycosyltransferase family 4 protein [Methanothermobacter sp.]|uniref:glycosyltransferase family 4 protein n=1 Tax=Methanothermobacter sp. TaxID=1884223 RepID=UPI00263388D9|nr:glycosyltransferase family 4 protein [Methanothermobacter sp.]MDI9615099.1 glycosyltransferase family 4 protein [Methanothermobacter sp.]